MEILSRYGFLGSLRLIRDAVITRFFFRGARLIRYPYYIRGRRYIDFGIGLTTGVGIRLDAFKSSKKTNSCVIKFGKNVQINDYVHIGAIENVEIGDNVLIASKVFISDHNHGSYSGNIHSSPSEAPKERILSSKPVKIGDNVWIGEFVSIMPGIIIGEGSVIGSTSVVIKSIPAHSISMVSPAIFIKCYNRETQSCELIP